MTIKYGFSKTMDLSFEQVLERVTQALQPEGFGVLTEIDVAATLKKKLDKEMPPYRILGACNPQLAHRALEMEPQIGLLLPCNIVVRQDEAGKVQVDFIDPGALLDLVGKPDLRPLANKAKQRLERVRQALTHEDMKP